MDAAPASPLASTLAGQPARGPLAGVSFARGSARSVPAAHDEAGARFTLLAATLVIGGTLLWIIARAIASFTGSAAPVVIGAGVLVGMFVLPAVAVIAAGYHTPRGWANVPTWADPARRVHVCCPPGALGAFGPIDDTAFEPEYARILLVAPKGTLDGLIYGGGALLAFPLVHALKMAFSVSVPPFFAIQAGFLAALVVIATLRQTYLRISPGRLDVLRFTMWKPAADSCRTFDLRSTTLVIDPRRRRIVIVSPNPDGSPSPGRDTQATVVSFLGAMEPRRIAHMLLRASISTAPTTDLPTDKLHD